MPRFGGGYHRSTDALTLSRGFPLQLPLSSDYWVPFFWGLVILASWLGWGQVAQRLLGLGARRIDWGLRGGWGLAVTLMIGGLLQLPRFATQNILMILALIGAAIWALTLYSELRAPAARLRLLSGVRRQRILLYIPLLILLLFLYATSVQAFDVNWWDDLPAYLVMVKRLQQTGAILDPYSWRRLATYGGQQLLDAQLLAGGTLFNIDILELGLAKILFVGLLLGMVTRKGMLRIWQHGAIAAVLLLLLFVPVPHLNTQSEMTGVVLSLTLIRTLLRARPRNRHAYHLAAAAGVVGAGISTLRMNFVPAAVLAIAFTYLLRLALEPRAWKSHLAQLGIAAAAFTAALLPWCLILYQSSGSLFFPLMLGTQRPEYKILAAPMNLLEKLRWLGDFARHPQALALIVPVFVIALRRRRWRTELPIYLAALLTMAMTILAFNRSDFENLYRYTFPIVFGSAAAAILPGLLTPVRRRDFVASSAAVLFMGIVFLPAGIAFFRDDRVTLWTRMDKSPLWSVVKSIPFYQEAQASIPPGQPVFVAASMPNLLDFIRNPLFICDAPGAASPDPGLPIFQGSQAVKAYLQHKGIHYLLIVDPNEDLTNFSRQRWTYAKEHADSQPDTFKFAYPFTLTFLDDMEELSKSEDLLYSDHALRVIHLK
jgi:hypothetical protein